MGAQRLSFVYLGTTPPNNVLLSLHLMVQSYYPELNLNKVDPHFDYSGFDELNNKLKMRERSQQTEKLFFKPCTSNLFFNFLALRLARLNGLFVVECSKENNLNISAGLVSVLGQVGSIVSQEDNELSFRSDHWHIMGDAIHIHGSDNSELAVAVLMNLWELPFPVCISLPKNLLNNSYLNFTIFLLHSLGMGVEKSSSELMIEAEQKINMSSVIQNYSEVYNISGAKL